MIEATLLIMAKAPSIGRGKSRLAADIGRVEAWRINCALHRATMQTARDPRWRTRLCVTPDRAVCSDLPKLWPRDWPREQQGAGDLGARLSRVLRGRRRVAVIGTDCPGLKRAHIANAFAALRRAPFALGPAADGGFWLLAARSGDAAAVAMGGVRWSSSHAAADVTANLGACNVAMLPTLRDIDSLADLRAWRRQRQGC